ncbi:respiratory burst oxidase homolog protein B-like [Abrus precatorius]|uniref:Respiratory burst oxidase homolog protein B-like n=1 Tax=Abrus precatorius TaxID=3816 RepID=A0A8B8LB58_ABRPR|nr:respiratory burst oxidase homolog protein B-like [Abrus precatorius]
MEIQEKQKETESTSAGSKNSSEITLDTASLPNPIDPVKLNTQYSFNYWGSRGHRGLMFKINGLTGSKGWNYLENRFDEWAVDEKLPKRRFGHCIGMNDSKKFADELFDALCRRGGITSSSITKDQLRQLWERSFDSRLHIFFDMVDKNADGRITEEDLKKIIAYCASINNLRKIQERAEEYAASTMEELDSDKRGFIEVYHLEQLFLEAEPVQSTNMTEDDRVLSQILSQKLIPTREFNPIKRWFRAITCFVDDNWKQIWILVIWLLICAALFIWKFIQYKHHAVFHVMGYCVTSAKGAAETLKFNMALILLPMCRKTITWLRSRTKLGMVVPFDDNINFHKMIAVGIAIGVGIHAISHLTCDFPRLLHATDKEYEPMKALFGGERPNNYWWFLKGTVAWTGITMVLLMAVAYMFAHSLFRQSRLKPPKPLNKLIGFNGFWYSHHLFVIVYLLFIIHGYYLYLSKKWYKKTTWMYLAIPTILYASDRLLGAFKFGYTRLQILKVVVYPGNVLALYMSKPQGFKYFSGQYIFVNCSDVSPFERHPFFITSAPGDEYVSVHIRTLGDWTLQLKHVFAQACQPASGDQSGILQGNNIQRMPKLSIEGPYGASTQDYKNYEVILLASLGIGATPMISILKDILYNLKQQKDVEEGMVENGVKDKRKGFAIKQAYFYWITREQGSFEWFKGVMDDVAEYDEDGIIELHNYCTSVYEEGDARSALITMLQYLHYAKNGVDIVSGTRVKTHFARPNWRSVFKHAALKHPGKRVGVFYCGPPTLAGEFKRLSLDFSRKTNTKFDFHQGF